MQVTVIVLLKILGLVGAVMVFVDPWGHAPSLELWFIPFVSAAFIGLSVAIDVERLRRGHDANWRFGGRVSATKLSVLLLLLGISMPSVVKSIAEKGVADLMSNMYFWIMAIGFLILAVSPVRPKTATHSR